MTPTAPPLHLRIVECPSAEAAALTDDELMQLVRGGRHDAFGLLVERHFSRLANYCGKYVGQPGVGEELAQEVLASLWGWRERYTQGLRFRLALLTFARNRCRNHLRERSRRNRWIVETSAPSSAEGEPAASSLALDGLLERERDRAVAESIARLPTRLREAVLLRYDQGLDYPDIARVLGKNESTVRSRVFHGLKRLRAELTGVLP